MDGLSILVNGIMVKAFMLDENGAQWKWRGFMEMEGINGNGVAQWEWRGSMEMERLDGKGGVRWKWRGSMEKERLD